MAVRTIKPTGRTPHLLTAGQAVEVLTVRKSRPTEVRVAAVLDRLTNQRDRDLVTARVTAYWAPLPARAKAQRRGPAPAPVVCGPGDQLALFDHETGGGQR